MSNLSFHGRRLFVQSIQERQEQIEKVAALFEAATLPPSSFVVVDNNGDNMVIRPLLPSEVDTLRGPCHCTCQDWSKLRLIISANESKRDQSSRLEQLVSYNTFADTVVIGLEQQQQQQRMGTMEVNNDSKMTTTHLHPLQRLSPGIHGNRFISNCIMEPNCRVYNNTFLSDTFVGEQAILLQCTSVSCTTPDDIVFGQADVCVGPESGGGRHLRVTVESTMIDVCQQLNMSSSSSSTKNDASHSHERPTSLSGSAVNIIGPNCIVHDTPTVENIYMAPYSNITAALSVRNTTLLSNAKITNGCTVSNVLLQWNSSITDTSSISDALLMEEAHVGPHSVVTSSILGPDVHVSAGEIHASALGPNTNAHHQSLVIGVLWPLGRGNVGYGANVGSNHTGRLPDQETTAGEGTFWGLSTVIKFPVDLSLAPYSIVAAGTNMPPQRITMPFSLIVEQHGVCHIVPGWVFQSSPYTLSRSETKFANRQKAKRHRFYTKWSICRPDIIDMCFHARTALEVANSRPSTVYKTDRQINGIGKCHITEKARMAGIRSYTQCIQLYALRGLLDKLVDSRQLLPDVLSDLNGELALALSTRPATVKSASMVSWPPLPWEQESSFWSHQLSVLRVEFPLNDGNLMIWIRDALQRLVILQDDHAKRIQECKSRDDVRGEATIPDYTDSHVAANDDPVVKDALAETSSVVERVNQVLAALGNSSNQSRSRL